MPFDYGETSSEPVARRRYEPGDWLTPSQRQVVRVLPSGQQGPLAPGQIQEEQFDPATQIRFDDPERIAARVRTLVDNGHAYLPPQVQFAFASAPNSDEQMLATLAPLRRAVASLHDGFALFHDDPVLQKQPSAMLALKSYLNQTIGPWPIADPDLSHIQRQLQTQGYGKGLDATGAWGQDWQAAYRDWSEGLTARQYGGDRPGSSTIGKALHALGSVLPKEAGNAIIGAARALPAQVHRLTADVAGGAVAGPQAIGELVGVGVQGTLQRQGYAPLAQRAGQRIQRTAAGVSGFVEHGGAGTPEGQIAEVRANPLGRAIEDVGTAVTAADAGRLLLEGVGKTLALHEALKEGGNAARAAGSNVLEDAALDTATAQASGGVVSRTIAANRGTAALRSPRTIAGMFAASGAKGVLTRGAIGAGAGGLAAEATGQDPWVGASIGAAALGLGGTQWAKNLPALSKIAPAVRSLADQEGLYYAARNILSMPYRSETVAALGNAVGKAGLYGAGLRGEAALSGLAGQATPFTRAVQGEHVLDGADVALRRFQRSALHLPFALGLNDAAFLIHPTPGSNYNYIGDRVQDVQDSMDHLLGPQSQFTNQIQLGLAREGKVPPITKLIEEAGGQADFERYWSERLREYAADYYADRSIAADALNAGARPGTVVNADGEILQWGERTDAFRAYTREARANPDILNQSLTEMAASKDNYLAKRVHQDVTNGLIDNPERRGPAVQNFIAASKDMEANVVPHEEELLGFHGGVLGRGDPRAGAQIGIARTETWTAQDAARRASHYRARLAALEDGGSVTDQQQLYLDIGKDLFTHFNVDISRWPDTVDGMVERLGQMGRSLAADLIVSRDAPEGVTAAFGRLRERGYKPVVGTDIGWAHRPDTPLDLASGARTWRRRFIERAGLNPNTTLTSDPSFYMANGVKRRIQALQDTGKVRRLPPGVDTNLLMRVIQDRTKIPIEPDPVSNFLASAFSAIRKPEGFEQTVEGIMARENVTRPMARDIARGSLKRAALDPIQVADLPREQVVDALSDPKLMEEAFPEVLQPLLEERKLAEGADIAEAAPGTLQLFDKREANLIYRALVDGRTDVPTGLIGGQHVEDLFRARMGFFGKPLTSASGKTMDLGFAIQNLPNALVAARNKYRFTLSPYFSLRRVAKTNAKLAVDGVPITAHPYDRLVESGRLDEATNLLEQALPASKQRYLYADEAMNILQQNDVLNLYNHQNFERYAALHWKDQGKSIDEIHSLLVKDFGYGSRAQEGRSALERSINMVFFPFSFDKTLYRNFGGYLLDRPAQLMVLTKGLAAYHTYNEHVKENYGGSWRDFFSTYQLEGHFPILAEASRLNAFAHGVSPGELGGINAPFLNMFAPQAWETNSQTAKTLGRFFPALRDVQRVLGEASDQADIGRATYHNAHRWITGGKVSASNPSVQALSRDAQLNEAYKMQRDWFGAYHDYLAYNLKQRDAAKRLRFGDIAGADKNFWGDFVDEPISKTKIREIIEKRYPAYSASTAGEIAERKRVEIDRYVHSRVGDPNYPTIKLFSDTAQKVYDRINRESFDPAEAALATGVLRDTAVTLALTDPSFAAFYRRNFSTAFGPLERVTRTGR